MSLHTTSADPICRRKGSIDQNAAYKHIRLRSRNKWQVGPRWAMLGHVGPLRILATCVAVALHGSSAGPQAFSGFSLSHKVI